MPMAGEFPVLMLGRFEDMELQFKALGSQLFTLDGRGTKPLLDYGLFPTPKLFIDYPLGLAFYDA